jgi:hypothetical protein
VACFRDAPGKNLGQNSDNSESCSSGLFSVSAVNFGLINLDRRNYLP